MRNLWYMCPDVGSFVLWGIHQNDLKKLDIGFWHPGGSWCSDHPSKACVMSNFPSEIDCNGSLKVPDIAGIVFLWSLLVMMHPSAFDHPQIASLYSPLQFWFFFEVYHLPVSSVLWTECIYWFWPVKEGLCVCCLQIDVSWSIFVSFPSNFVLPLYFFFLPHEIYIRLSSMVFD